jgi:formate hydrogenlyase subunit 3/multisubunit Na+/H+ antiporter MnhD subunit
VVAPALALSWAGVHLLTLAAGTALPGEQWGVLALTIDPPTLWRTALPLSLLAGAVLVGAAPFHAWLADLLHGGRAWAAPLTAAALQGLGMAWLAARVAGVEAHPEAAALASGLLGFGATVAFVAGAATLVAQRRPERRVGTLASLQGGLVMASFAAAHAGAPLTMPHADAWAAHLVLALAGAGLVARFLPVAGGPASAAALFRRHPLAGFMGLFALLSLAGVPGTPGARLWFETARALAHAGRVVPLYALGAAWVTAFVVAMREARAAFGVPAPAPPQPGEVPWPARAALWVAALGLVLFGIAWGWRG